MNVKNDVSRRHFMGGMAAAVGSFGLSPNIGLLMQNQGRRTATDDYDLLVKPSR